MTLGLPDADRLARKIALDKAVENAGHNVPAEEIVEDAEKFHAFLTGKPTTPTSESE